MIEKSVNSGAMDQRSPMEPIVRKRGFGTSKPGRSTKMAFQHDPKASCVS